MKTQNELVAFCMSKIGTRYVYGAKGEKLTEEKLNALSRDYKNTFTSEYIRKSQKYLGQPCTDCSGLISWCTGILRGSSEYCSTAQESQPFNPQYIRQKDPAYIGWALWKRGHIGVYVGNGYCVEARGINYGTIYVPIENNHWEQIIKLKDIDYQPAAKPHTRKKDDAHPAEPVKQRWMQENGRWRYYHNGVCIKNDWHKDADTGRWYRFDESGYAISGQWLCLQEKKYYFKDDCSMVTGQYIIDGQRRQFGDDGALVTAGGKFKNWIEKLMKK